MGGDYYGGRDVISVTSSSGSGSNSIGNNGYHPSLDPKRWKEDNLQSEALHPIIFALDITGSMGEWIQIIYNKMPMFYGQIMMQKYLTDPAISFCAIEDATCHDYHQTLQVTEFGQGKAIDQLLCKMLINGCGGGNDHESYDMAAYFYSNHVDLLNCEIPFFFLTGDEAYWETESSTQIEKVFGHGIKTDVINSIDNWNLLMTKYNVFMIKKEYNDFSNTQWNQTLGEERIMRIKTPKACVDVILGAIALTSGAKDLKGYVEDMKTRGQTEERILEVTDALSKYAEKLEKGQIQIIRNQISTINSQKIQNSNIQEGIFKISETELNQIVQQVQKLWIEESDNEVKIFREKLIKLQLGKGESIPNEFLCPLTKSIMIEPVMTCDGYSFEKSAIELWMQSHENNPVTGILFESKALLPNIALKQFIKDFSDSN